MAVDISNIRLFITNQGYIIGEGTHEDENFFVTMKHPLRLVPRDDGHLGIAALLIKEEWVTLSRSNSMEIDVPNGLVDLYVEYEKKIHDPSPIIMPNSGNIVL